MPAAQGAATFTIAAKDAASSVIGKIGKSMGGLRSAAETAFKALAAGAAVAASAIAGIAIASIKGAVEDEKAQTRMVATLRARGLATKDNIAAIDALIASAQNLGMTDDQVRASIETATQYTKKFSDALKINKVAQDLAIAKGIDLESATAMVGKAYAGNGKALKQLGINLQKTVYWTDVKTKTDKKGHVTTTETNKSRKETIKGLEALALITKQYGGIAAEVANTTAVKFEAAQIALNEKFEAFGYRFLPAVSDALTILTKTVFPAVDTALTVVGDAIFAAGAEISKPGGMLESVGAVAGEFFNSMKPGVEAVASALGPFIQAVLDLAGALWGDGKGPLAVAVVAIGETLNNLMLILKPVLDILTAIINAINTVIGGAAKLGANPANNQGYVPSYGMTPGASSGGYTYGGTSTGGVKPITINTNVILDSKVVGTSVNGYLGNLYSGSSSRQFTP